MLITLGTLFPPEHQNAPTLFPPEHQNAPAGRL
jgi:hypothetical protein